MTDLLDKILARAAELLTGHLFDSEEGGQKEIEMHKRFLPPPRQAGQEDRPHPFLITRLMGGQEGDPQGSIRARIIAEIYTADDENAGGEDIERLAGILLRLREEYNFFPYIMEEGISWFFGDDKEGVQMHPYHCVTLDMVFSVATNP